MLWGEKISYFEDPFELEKDLESAIEKVAMQLFGSQRCYLPVKKKIGGKSKIRNIPDGYLIDLTSTKDPKLYVVENELAKHDPLKHIAVQILEFSLSFETSTYTVKSIVKEAIQADLNALSLCDQYLATNNVENIDVLLEKMIYGEDRFNALVIIDELSEELEKALISRFKFPVEILTIERFKNNKGEKLYKFQPFLSDLSAPSATATAQPSIDPSDLDTIVVPAREEGFNEVFINENRWYQIRIHSSMIPKIKYIAGYQVAPVSAITHIAPVSSIERWKDTAKYVLNFSEPAKKIGPIELVSKGKVKPPFGPRYTSMARLKKAKTMEEAF